MHRVDYFQSLEQQVKIGILLDCTLDCRVQLVNPGLVIVNIIHLVKFHLKLLQLCKEIFHLWLNGVRGRRLTDLRFKVLDDRVQIGVLAHRHAFGSQPYKLLLLINL